ncbi:MAG: DUF4416 family protein [Candidatus Binatia bacterium]
MGTPTLPQPVKLLIALLSADPALFATVTTRLEQAYGPVDLESDIFPWNTTDYYHAEMGENLLRKFVAFAHLVSPEHLARIKLETNALEVALASSPDMRRINLDPGYLDANKLVLASTKNQAHRVYLSQGIYGEVTLLFHHGAFHPFIYTYADYRWPEVHAFLQQVRARYLEQLRTK